MSVLEYGYADSGDLKPLSNSMIQTYLMCSHKAKTLYGGSNKLNRLEVPPSLSVMTAGVVIHKVLELNLTEPDNWLLTALDIIQSERLLPGLTDVVFRQHYEYVKRRLSAKPDLKSPSYMDAMVVDRHKTLGTLSVLDTITPTEFLDSLFVSLVKAEKMEVHVKYASCERERKFEYTNPSLGYLLTGTADLFYIGKKQLFIGDYKTGMSAWTPQKIINNPQFNHYAYMARKEFDLPPSHPVTVTVLALRLGQRISATLTEEHEARYIKYLEKALHVVDDTEKGALNIPASASSMGCPCVIAAMGQCPYKTA
jgi:hypothetical protein